MSERSVVNVNIWILTDNEGPWWVVRQREGEPEAKIGPMMTEKGAFREMGDIINEAGRLNQLFPASPREIYHPSYEVRRGH
jgi:hypothetical protein